MTKVDTLIFLLLVIFATSLIGGHFGYTVNGVPQGGIAEGSNILIDGMSFFYNMLTFQVDDCPIILNTVWIFLNLLTVFFIFWSLRG